MPNGIARSVLQPVPQYLTYSLRTSLCVATVMIATEACASRPGSDHRPEVRPTTTTETGARPDSTLTLVLPNIFEPGQVAYDVSVTSVVESVTGDSLPRVDSARALAQLSIAFSKVPDGRIRVDAQVDSIRINTIPPAARAGQAGVVSEFYVVLGPRSRVTRQQPTQSPTCTLEQATTFLTGEEVLPALPVLSPIPTVWTDTTRVELCRGGVPLRITRIAQYRPDQSEFPAQTQAPSFRFIRSTRVTVQGQGIQWQQPVEVTGHGTSTDTLMIVASRLSTISGQGSLELFFQSQFRSQQLRQTSHVQFQARK
jgi:hypothetical protein